MGMQDGLDAIVERQARQMRTIGVVLLVLGVFVSGAAIYDAITRSRTVLRELAQKRAEREQRP